MPGNIESDVTSPHAATSRRWTVLRSVGRALRDTWMILGGSLLVLVAAESCYRVQGELRRAVRQMRAKPAAPNPYAKYAWWKPFRDEEESSLTLAWDPYVYFRRAPYQGVNVHVDANRHRETFQPGLTSGPHRQVYLFGGSTMFGTFQRDSMTIASRLADRLRKGGLNDVEVSNFGELGWVMTQETIELMRQLRAGHRPDVVVFYDGINEVGSAVQQGKAGIPDNEFNRAQDFELGRAVYSWKTTVRADAVAGAKILEVAANRSQLYRRLRDAIRPSPPPGPTTDSLTRDIARTYLATVDLVEALAQRYGFVPIYIWQSSLHATRKQLTPFERELMTSIDRSPVYRQMKVVHLALPAILDTAMARKASGRFVDEEGLFAGDTMSVYGDFIGHVFEQGVPYIVNGFWEPLRGALATKPSTQSDGLKAGARKGTSTDQSPTVAESRH